MSFCREHVVKSTRKDHRCDGCTRTIEARSQAVRWQGMSDGQFHSAIYHVDCRAAEIALNDLADWRDGDDWFPLRNVDENDREWLQAEHPTVFARMFPNPPTNQGTGNG